MEAHLAAPDIRQLAARDHQGGHREREDRDGRLDAAHGGAKVRGDAADGHVHARGRVAAEELRQDQRQEHRTGGRRSHRGR